MSTLIAKCYLLKDDDPKNICFLTDETLTIVYKGNKQVFFKNWVKTLVIKSKMFLLPIVFGGIIAPLAALGLFQYYLNPWIMMSLFFGALLLMYYGIQGATALVVITPIKEYDFFLPSTSENLKAFIAFANSHAVGSPIKFYFSVNSDTYEKWKETQVLSPPKEGLKLTTASTELAEGDLICFIESENLPFEIKYTADIDGRFTPKVFDEIPFSYIQLLK